MSLIVVGISAYYHDSACCLLKDGVLVAAAQEERFSLLKHDAALPKKAFLYCLREAGVTIADVDHIAFYEDPARKLARQVWSGVIRKEGEGASLHLVQREIKEILGYDGPVTFVDHHLSHAASSFFFSGFESSAILTVDGVGEWATTTYGVGEGSRIRLFEEVHFPDSIGLLYSTITSYLGFEVNDGEYKVMGLAPYGEPLYADKIRKLIRCGQKGQFQLDMKYFDFLKGNRMYSEDLISLFERLPRSPESELSKFAKDVARSLQVVLEELLLEKCRYLRRETNAENLCMAGGVALNCVANGKIRRSGIFKDLFVQPAASDAGGALGAAAWVHAGAAGTGAFGKMQHVYLGDGYSNEEIARVLGATFVVAQDFRGRTDELLDQTALRLSRGEVIGWFQGRMEFGPRALGGRSILGDPRNPDMRNRVNLMVKKREGFRPFAPAVLASESRHHFDLAADSPFMLETCQVTSPLDLPAITHVDGSARVQTVAPETNPLFAGLLTRFGAITGCPILLNTSFNVRGMPIVRSPLDALECFIETDINCLVMGDFLIDKAQNPMCSRNALQFLEKKFRQHHEPAPALQTNVYTFI
ncbi:MAG: carbamoyltransferase [Cytophagales bacterium]|nr:carbamoyltransferase [Cytophagales bacterium]